LWDKTSKSNIVWASEEFSRKQAERVDAKSGTIGQTIEIVFVVIQTKDWC
jgi:hypothetical protein